MEPTTPTQTDFDQQAFDREQAELDRQQERINKAALPYPFSQGLSQAAACRYVGIDLPTLHHWLQTDSDLAEKVTYGRIQAVD